jgi:hypothetical protein
MAAWAWYACALGIGLLISVEAWAWMRHRVSAVALVVGGTLSVGAALAVLGVVVGIAYGVVAGIAGDDVEKAASSSGSEAGEQNCDSNYKGECLDPDALDYDCAGGSGDGPEYAGPVEVVGSDPYGLDRDGDGFACE